MIKMQNNKNPSFNISFPDRILGKTKLKRKEKKLSFLV